MVACGAEILCAFLNNDKIIGESVKELTGSETIQIFYHAVVIKNGKLVGWKANRHKIIVFFFTVMVRIVLGFLCAYKSCRSRAMMSVGNVKRRHLGKTLCDEFLVISV